MTVWVMLVLLFADGDLTPHALQFIDELSCQERIEEVLEEIPGVFEVYASCIPFDIEGEQG